MKRSSRPSATTLSSSCGRKAPSKNGDFVAVGRGILDVPGIVAKAKELGYAKYIIVELDNLNSVEAVDESLRYLNRLV